jgi:hypothetical protein
MVRGKRFVVEGRKAEQASASLILIAVVSDP